MQDITGASINQAGKPPKHKSNPQAKPMTHDFNLNSFDVGLRYFSMQGKLQTRATKPIIPQ